MRTLIRTPRATLTVVFLAVSLAVGLLAGCQGKPEEQTPERAQPPPERPLLIENVVVRELAPDRAVVSWSTSIPSNGPAHLGTDRTQLDIAVPAPALTTLHRVVFDSLEPGREYFYAVTARSMRGQEAVSDTLSLRTPAIEAEPTDESFDVAVIETRFGTIVFRFLEERAPRHSASFKKLAREGYFNGTTFHRVMEDILIQGGDPLSRDDDDRRNDGTGGPGYQINAEIGAIHIKGAVGAARNDNPQRRSNGSQFYICLQAQPQFDHKYTVFGRVIDGLEVAQAISEVSVDDLDNPLNPVPVTIRIEQRRMSDFF